uniref:Uncharacterized protein n=1 Tax=viral metagenome TaxID=1070528 RepID=A0A6C0HUN5_9ZZZZ
METHCYNIDSKFRNTTTYPNSSDFVFNRVDEVIGSSTVIEPFNEKNVIEMKLSSLEIPNTMYYITTTKINNTIKLGATDIIVPNGSYTKQELVTYLDTALTASGVDVAYSSTTGKVTIVNNSGSSITFPASGTSYYSLGQILGFLTTTTILTGTTVDGTNTMKDPQFTYFFLRINDYGNIINKNRRYVSKILTDSQARYNSYNQETFIKLMNNVIKFDQPTDIVNLKISLEDEFGNNVSLNGNDWSFTLETSVITNTILKNYEEIKFYNEEVMDKILKSKMLAYYEKQVPEKTNSALTSNYSSNLVNLNNVQEYTSNGSSNNYSPSYSYFRQ